MSTVPVADAVRHYRALVGAAVSGRRWVVVSRSADRAAATARRLAGYGAAGTFLVVGEPTAPDRRDPGTAAGLWCADLTGDDDGRWDRSFDRILTAPPADLLAALDRFDPAREAFVLDSRDQDRPDLLGRARYGWRRPAWALVEDKVRVGGIWRESGVDHAPELVTVCRTADLAAAARRLDRGLGTVWAGDASNGPNSGGTCTRWVRDDAQAAAAVAYLRQRCARVRVMPFVEGVPCSVHALVVEDAVAVLRPLEIVVYRFPDGRFGYGGVSTYWDPAPADAALIRDSARAVGHTLARQGYRGGFTLDAVLGPAGLVPTEINARLGTGLNLTEALPGLDVDLIDRMLREGDGRDYRPALLERVATQALAGTRFGYAKVGLTGDADAASFPLTGTADGRYRRAGNGGRVDAVVTVERPRRGPRVRYTPTARHIGTGLLGPRSVAALDLLRSPAVPVPPVAVGMWD